MLEKGKQLGVPVASSPSIVDVYAVHGAGEELQDALENTLRSGRFRISRLRAIKSGTCMVSLAPSGIFVAPIVFKILNEIWHWF